MNEESEKPICLSLPEDGYSGGVPDYQWLELLKNQEETQFRMGHDPSALIEADLAKQGLLNSLQVEQYEIGEGNQLTIEGSLVGGRRVVLHLEVDDFDAQDLSQLEGLDGLLLLYAGTTMKRLQVWWLDEEPDKGRFD